MGDNFFILCILVINLLSFIVGAKVGQKVVKGETVELPKIEPLKAVKEYQESKEVQKEQDYYKTIAENIDNYDGTGIGQKDIPR